MVSKVSFGWSRGLFVITSNHIRSSNTCRLHPAYPSAAQSAAQSEAMSLIPAAKPSVGAHPGLVKVETGRTRIDDHDAARQLFIRSTRTGLIPGGSGSRRFPQNRGEPHHAAR